VGAERAISREGNHPPGHSTETGDTVFTIHSSPVDLADIFSLFGDRVYRFIYARVGNKEDAEDLTSAVFLKAARNLDIDRSENSIAAWLFTVVRTVIADYWRAYYRTGVSVSLDNEDRLPLIDDAVQTKGGLDKTVDDILATLPARYRQVLELRFLRGYSIEDIARELDTTPGNVKVMQHRGLARAAERGAELFSDYRRSPDVNEDDRLASGPERISQLR